MASAAGQVDFSPAFIWLLRDFQLRLEADNKAITPAEYLEEALLPIKGGAADISNKNQVCMCTCLNGLQLIIGASQHPALCKACTAQQVIRGTSVHAWQSKHHTCLGCRLGHPDVQLIAVLAQETYACPDTRVLHLACRCG